MDNPGLVCPAGTRGGLPASVPLLYNEGLPKLALLAPLLAPAPPPAAPPAQPRHSLPPAAQSNMMGIRLVAPPEIPRDVSMLTETAPPPPMIDPGATGIRHGTGDAQGRGCPRLNPGLRSGSASASAGGPSPSGLAHDGREPHLSCPAALSRVWRGRPGFRARWCCEP